MLSKSNVKVTFSSTEFLGVKSKISLHVDRVVQQKVFTKLDAVVAEGANDVRKTIKNSMTPTGIKRAKGGGESGRIETGAMLRAVKGARLSSDVNTYHAKIGWFTAETPHYTAHQEFGTELISPMLALGSVYENTRVRIGRF